MQTIFRAAMAPGATGTALPSVYQVLADAGIHIRAGELTLIAGEPGAGKSTIAEDMAVKMGVPGLYFSCDSDPWTMAVRLAAMKSGRLLADEERMLNADDEHALEALNSANHLRWVFDSSPSLEDIGLEVDAYYEVMGEDPKLIVIDNLMDIVNETGDAAHQGWQGTIRELKWLARDIGAAVIVLHHTKEDTRPKTRDYEPPECPPRSAVQGLVNQLPAMILTLGNKFPGIMSVAAVKNRHGKADRSGNTCHWLSFDPARMQLQDQPRIGAA